MPTIGQVKFGLADSAFALGDFERDNFLPLVFLREEAALDIAFRFAAMRPFYVSCACASHKLLCGGTRCPQRVGPAAAGRLRRRIFAPSPMLRAHTFRKVDPPA